MGFLLFILFGDLLVFCGEPSSVSSFHLFKYYPSSILASHFTTLSVKPSHFILPASLSTFPVFISLSLSLYSIRAYFFALTIFSAVPHLLLQLFIEILVSIIFLYLKVVFGSPSNRIGSSLYFLIQCIVISCFLYFFKHDNPS